MGLRGTVIAAGYRREDYRQALASFDAGLMLMPGTDGSCRAAMQMAAMGKPLIVARRGVLPDVVVDGRTGIVVKDTPANLAEAVLEMAADADRRAEWGAAARERMCRLFSLPRCVDEVEALYARLLSRGMGPT
jgi:glycosyltransferase involved in cell wall biosynthesis